MSDLEPLWPSCLTIQPESPYFRGATKILLQIGKNSNQSAYPRNLISHTHYLYCDPKGIKSYLSGIGSAPVSAERTVTIF